MMQRDTTGLTAENKELKLRLQAMEQQAQLRDGNVLLIFYAMSRFLLLSFNIVIYHQN